MFQLPALALSLVLATGYAILWLLVTGQGIRRLPLTWLASIAGFIAGQWAGRRLDLIPWAIGQVRIVEATLASFLFLVLAHWLTQERKRP